MFTDLVQMTIIISLPLNYTGFDCSRNKAPNYSCDIEVGDIQPCTLLETTAVSAIMPAEFGNASPPKALRFWPRVVRMANIWLYD